MSLSKSQQQLVEEKNREVDELGVAKTHLQHQLADLTETMKEKEEDYKMQVCGWWLTLGAVHVEASEL